MNKRFTRFPPYSLALSIVFNYLECVQCACAVANLSYKVPLHIHYMRHQFLAVFILIQHLQSPQPTHVRTSFRCKTWKNSENKLSLSSQSDELCEIISGMFFATLCIGAVCASLYHYILYYECEWVVFTQQWISSMQSSLFVFVCFGVFFSFVSNSE